MRVKVAMSLEAGPMVATILVALCMINIQYVQYEAQRHKTQFAASHSP
jgi:uncharacterized protein involved in cysteine biosynthesis